jgi:hypothetical protein
MLVILPHLYLSDLQTAQTLTADDAIHVVISIGCVCNHMEGIEYLEFPAIPDDPKVFLMSIWDYTSSYIAERIAKEVNVLVHCVYGQSRSVSTIIAYMLRYCKHSLTDALMLLRSKKPDISINPGFLSQLWCIDYVLNQSSTTDILNCRGMIHALYQYSHDFLYNKHLTTPSTLKIKTLLHELDEKITKFMVNESIEAQQPEEGTLLPALTSNLYCGYCRTFIVSTERIIHKNLNECVMSFLDEHVDDFWRHSYRRKKSTKKSKRKISNNNNTTTSSIISTEQVRIDFVTVPIKGYELIAPTDWMIEEQQQKRRNGTEGEKGEIHCPSCHRMIGEYKKESLTILGDLFVMDAYMLSTIAIRRW